MDQQVQKQNEKLSNQPDSQQKTVNPEAELIKDLTIGLPGSLKLLQESLLLFSKNFRRFLAVTAVVIIPLYGLYKLSFLFNLQSPLIINIYNFIFIYAVILLSSFMSLALLFAIKNNEENIGLIACYKLAKVHFLEYWKVILIAFGLTIAGKLFFIIPGLILLVWFSVSLMVYLVEELKGIDALLVSKYYIQSYWSSVCLRLVFIAGLVVLVLLPLFLMWQTQITSYLSDLYLLLILFIVLPVVSTYLFLIYGNLRLLKPNSAELIEALNKTTKLKLKLRLLKPAFIEGAIAGIPLLLMLVYLYIVRIYKVTGNSMSPNYKDDELVFTKVYSKNFDKINRGDVVIFNSPIDRKRILIKRVIGVPNEEFGIINGKVNIDSMDLDESAYLTSDIYTEGNEFIKSSYRLKIPANNYIVLGDNRTDSNDSRNWGLIRESDIIGIVKSCIWNCKKSD